MSTIAYLSSFSSTPTMTLHDGSSYFSQQLVTKSPMAMVNYITLPNYVLYDPNGTTKAATMPQAIEAVHLIRLSTQTLSVDKYREWCEDVVGQRATLTGVEIDGGNVTCTARLESAEAVLNGRVDLNRIIKVKLVFQPLTDWA